MKRHLSPAGFAGIEILLILSVLLLIGGIGVYVYGKNRPNITVSNTSTTAPTDQGVSTSPNGIPEGSQKPATPSPSSSSETVVAVTSAGFQITVPASLSNLTYHVRNMGNNVLTVSFSSQSLTASIPACAAETGTGAFSTISRGAGNYPGPANPSSGGLLKQYSGYYFAYTLPNGPCAKGLTTEQQNLLNQLTEDFYGSLGSVKAL